MTANRFTAIASALETIRAMQLPTAMSSYGPMATGVWATMQVVSAIRRRQPSQPATRSDHEQLDLVAVHPRRDLR
jgi:hypothetical protein